LSETQPVSLPVRVGKRQAKRYVRKALAFALQMGYLIPMDTKGKLLRLSPILANAVQRKQYKGRLTKKKLTKKTPQKKRDRRKGMTRVASISEWRKRKCAGRSERASHYKRRQSNQKLVSDQF
jgi:hypothetical protein